MRLHYFLFVALWYKYSFSFSPHNNNNNSENSTHNNNNSHNNNNTNSSIMPYTSVGSHSSLYTFTLNVITNTYLSKKSKSPAIKAVPQIFFNEIFN